jgi:hypothetical protein
VIVVADITATVRSIWTDPETISLGNLSLSERQTSKLYVMSAGNPDAKVTSAETTASWITLTSKPVTTSEQLKKQRVHAIDYYEIEWTGQDAQPGNLSATLIFHVQDGDGEKILEVPVTGYLSGDVEIIPAQLVFGRVGKEQVVRNCTLTSSKDAIDPSKIQCSADHEWIKIQLKNSKEAPGQIALTASISLPEKITDSLIEGNITGKDETGKIVFSVPYLAFFDDNKESQK